MKPLRTFLLVALALSCLQPVRVFGARAEALGVPSSIGTIQMAYEAGEISETEAVLYKLYALRHSSSLPAKFLSDAVVPMKCGTMVVLDVRQDLDKMPAAERQEAVALLARPVLDSYIDTAHFRVHYATSGAAMISGWPSTTYRDAVTNACETSWTCYHTTNGWPTPPSDGTTGGGSGLIDCYVDDLGTGAYGVTYPESTVPGGHPYDSTAYFVIDNDYPYLDFGYADNRLPMRVTVAHEYHHVVQIGLDEQNSGAWFMENTSTYMEDEVFDTIDDNYNYLQYMLNNPWMGLRTTNSGFEYGAFLWPTYLDERLGGQALVRDVWVSYADITNLYTCFDNNLTPFGKNLDTAMAEWTRWNIFTWLHDDANHYAEGSAYYPYVAYDKYITSYPQTNVHPSTTPTMKRPRDLGANYTRFDRQSGSTDNKITITYQVLNSCSYNHVISFVRKFTGESVFEQWDVPVDATGAAAFEMTHWDETEFLYMSVPMKRGCDENGTDFRFSVSTTYTVDVADLPPASTIRLDQNSPNPFHPSTAIRFALRESGPVRIAVHDASGREVRSLLDTVLPAGEHEVHWGGTDGSGRPAASGFYFYSLEANGEKTVRKMTLAR